MDNEQLIEILMLVLVGIVFIVFILIGVFAFIKLKEKKKAKEENTTGNSKSTSSSASNKQSIFKFMEFDTVKDNMIIQKNGTRFLMVIECQGINYDLMSGVEKTGVEEGFVQFLNTLRHKIQIYIQTRAINL